MLITQDAFDLPPTALCFFCNCIHLSLDLLKHVTLGHSSIDCTEIITEILCLTRWIAYSFAAPFSACLLHSYQQLMHTSGYSFPHPILQKDPLPPLHQLAIPSSCDESKRHTIRGAPANSKQTVPVLGIALLAFPGSCGSRNTCDTVPFEGLNSYTPLVLLTCHTSHVHPPPLDKY